MRKVIFEKVMNGIERVAIPKEKVQGYRHSYSFGIHYYRRGHKQYMVDTNDGECVLEKFDLRWCRYLDVSYDDFHRFIDIRPAGIMKAEEVTQ